jgi:Dehydrogenases with different specificities (related to short-chain alcohol dehydrogenases)
MREFEDRVALVTGGGRGIGREIALGLAREGCDVAIVARTSEQIEQVAHEIRQIGRRALALACDISNKQAVTAAYQRVNAELGPIAILVNNAAIVTPVGPTADVDPEQWAQDIAINLVGAFRCILLCLPYMLSQHWGRIVSISSGAAAGTGMLNANAYTVSKAGLEMLTLNLAEEYKDSGVTINAIRPGTVDTEMQFFLRTQPAERVGAAIPTQFGELHRAHKLLHPELPARLTINLLKDEQRSGEIISIADQQGQMLLNAQQ